MNEESMDKKDEILALKKEKKAIILAHYYQEPDIQDVADFVGDSLGLSQQAASTDAEIIVFAGVHFMAETAKILNPGKKVLLPDAGAGCSLADSCPPAKFKEFLAAHPDHTAVTYINCSAEIKALSDIICTSANAIDVVNSIPEGKPIIFAPDRNLGRFVAQQTGRDLLLWQGACVVHEAFSKTKIESLICAHPDARMIAHPESTAEILEKADFIGSTSAMIEFIQKDPADKFIIATEAGILHQMRKKVPHKTLIPAPSVENNSCACSECPYMKMNTLDKLLNCLRYETPAIEVPEDIRKKALQPLARMLEISSRKKGKTTIHAAH